MKISEENKKEFIALVTELLTTKEVSEMKNYIQHGKTTTLEHCLAVAYTSYLAAQKLPFSFDYKSLVRGAMLHDFYLYDWHIREQSQRYHGFVHPTIAAKNAKNYFNLNQVEIDIIERHMWPLTFRKFPTKREVLLVCLVDKYCSFAETFYLSSLSKSTKALFRLTFYL